jgi:hypothetical protein
MKINQKKLSSRLIGFCLLSATFALRVQAADSKPTPAAGSTNTARVRFLPPTTAAAAVRVTGGSRGAGDTATTLDVLAPDQVGLTTQEQPSLFWFQSKPAEARFELTLLQEKKVKPLLRVNVERAAQAGVQRIKLSEHGVKLTLGVEYQWVVALTTDPDNRSSDLVASGVIKRVEPSSELKAKLAGATPATLADVYAQGGIWYDTLAALSDQIEQHPNDSSLRQARADLLRQVGLTAAATAESALAAK